MNRRDFGLLILLGAVWGASYLLMRIAAPVLGPLPLMAARLGVAAIALWIYCIAVATKPDWRAGLEGTLAAVSHAGPAQQRYSLHTYRCCRHLAQRAVAAILNATTPLFTAIVATLWLGEAFGLRKLVGILLGIVGVAVLMGWSPLPLTGQTVIAATAALLAALSYGVAAVYARIRFQGVPPVHTAVGQLTGSTLILLPLAMLRPPVESLTLPIAAAVLALALVCTAFAYLLYFHLIASAGATQAATVTFLVPFFSVLWGGLLLDEPLNAAMVFGLGTIMVSVWLVLGTGIPKVFHSIKFGHVSRMASATHPISSTVRDQVDKK